MKFYLLRFLGIVFILLSLNSFAQSSKGIISVNDTMRSYGFYIPAHLDASKTYPLVIVLHGGRGKGSEMSHFTGFNIVADREQFIVCYPEGYNHAWNDHRIGSKLMSHIDDVKFISMLIDEMIANHHADPKRVFITGISNGAIMSLFLAQQLPGKIRGIAAVCGSIPDNYASTYHISNNLSVMVINGTDDPLVKYDGGPVLFEYSDRGAVIPTDSMIQKLLKQLNCHGQPDVYRFPDINNRDESTAVKYSFRNCGDKQELIFIKVTGGGHTWPGGTQYLPRLIIGNVCKDFSATDEIWNFFKQQVY